MDLQTFRKDGLQIRTAVFNDTVWFVGRDVAEVLTYDKPRNAIRKHVEEKDKLKRDIIDSTGTATPVTFINEMGMYKLVLASKTPTAEQVKKWITAEIVPETIRNFLNAGQLQEEETEFKNAFNSYLKQLERRIEKLESRQKELENRFKSLSRTGEPEEAKQIQDLNTPLKLYNKLAKRFKIGEVITERAIKRSNRHGVYEGNAQRLIIDINYLVKIGSLLEVSIKGRPKTKAYILTGLNAV